jgi:hypothetical protein
MSVRITQHVDEVVVGATGSSRVTQHVIEALIPVIARSPTTITGAGITQHVAEAIVGATGAVRVTHHIIEMIVVGDYDGGGPGGGVTHTFGYAT